MFNSLLSGIAHTLGGQANVLNAMAPGNGGHRQARGVRGVNRTLLRQIRRNREREGEPAATT
jgi:hypothetical protein